MENVQPCTHTLQSGPRRGKTCDVESVRESFCQSHLRLSEPDQELNTCRYQFTRGNRKDMYCPNTAVDVNGDGYCDQHACISDPDTIECCSHIFKSGYRKGFHCTEKPVDGGACWKHSIRSKSCEEPKMVVFKSKSSKSVEDSPENEQTRTTCHHQFSKGEHKGMYCSRISVGDTEFCRIHSKIDHSKKDNSKKDNSNRETRSRGKRCTHILLAGRSRGKRCQRTEENSTGFCRMHAKMVNLCQHIFIIERRCKNFSANGGFCANHHPDDNGTKEEASDSDTSEC